MKPPRVLIASSPTLDRIRALAASYYVAPDTALVVNGDEWEVHTNGVKRGAVVRKKGKRFQLVIP